jgi:hypothetical protein
MSSISISEQILELLDGQTSVTDNCSHRVGIDRIIARYNNPHRTLRHENVFSLSINVETRFLQRFDGAQVIYAGTTSISRISQRVSGSPYRSM